MEAINRHTLFTKKPIRTFLRILRGIFFEQAMNTEQRLRATYDRLKGDETFENLLAKLESETRPDYIISLGKDVLLMTPPGVEGLVAPAFLPHGLSKFMLILHDKILDVVSHFETALGGMCWVYACQVPTIQKFCDALLDNEVSFDTLYDFCTKAIEHFSEEGSKFYLFSLIFDKLRKAEQPWFSPFRSTPSYGNPGIRLTEKDVRAILGMEEW